MKGIFRRIIHGIEGEIGREYLRIEFSIPEEPSRPDAMEKRQMAKGLIARALEKVFNFLMKLVVFRASLSLVTYHTTVQIVLLYPWYSVLLHLYSTEYTYYAGQSRPAAIA